MNNNTLDNMRHNSDEEILDIGKQLKSEKLQKENQEKVEKLKASYAEEQKKEQQKKEEEEKRNKDKKSDQHKIVLFLTIIIFLAIGIRLYVASMPITESWAETVVEDNLKRQVTNKITTEYPTLSEAKTQELILQGTRQALATKQNQDAIEALSSSYKESYRDPGGNSYLYEIDPYFFYEIAQNKDSTLNIAAHNLLSFIERWFHSLVQFIFPDVAFVEAIFYLPLLFTLLCAIILFFIGKELWNETAGFIAGLFFVSHPILLEFSLLGFVDTNMVNIFFILATGLLFLYAIKIIRTKAPNIKKYSLILFLIITILLILLLFRYNWSAWYVGVGLIVLPFALMLLVFFKNFMFSWKIQIAKRKRKFIAGAFVFLVVCGGLLYYGFKKEEGDPQNRIEKKILTPTLKKYLHLKYEDPYGVWPDAFSLIKELQSTNLSIFVEYLGGNITVLLSFPLLFYLFYKGFRDNNAQYLYFVVGYLIFFILSIRTIRILPYFIPFFAVSIGIAITVIVSLVSNKIQPSIAKEKKVIQSLCIILFYLVLILPVAYPIAIAVQEKSSIMPIMDDAIYNSAIYIKENSEKDAIVSTWWDRGTFYKALAEREVHLHSQPHMPRTYWLASFYTTNNEIQAKNILSMLNCNYVEAPLFEYFSTNFSKKDAIENMHTFLGYDSYQTKIEYLAHISDDKSIAYAFLDRLSCDVARAETYIVVIDDLMLRFSAVQYFAAWDFATMQPDTTYSYTDIVEYGCLRLSSGVYCTVQDRNVYVNFTSLQVTGQIPVHDVYVVENNTVTYLQQNTTETSSTNAQQWTLIIYQRVGYWKAVYLPKIVADGMYIKLMLLDGYNLTYFEKVFDEVHAETSWVKMYKVRWDAVEE